MNLSVFIKRPVLSTVISIIVVILGLLGLVSLPITQYPDIAPPTISVSASYPGASAETILNSVIAPLEEQINGVENMTYMTSTASNDGSATITVYFKLGTDPDMAAVNVQNRVTRATSLLPQEVIQTGVSTRKRMTSMLMVFTIYSESKAYDETFIQNYANINVLPQITRVSGVGEAMIWGSRDYSMRIWLKPDVMSRYGVTPDEISAVLAEQNIEAAPGKFGEQGNQSYQYTIKYKGRLQTAKEFEDMVVRADQNGNILRVKDIARVELGAQDYSMSTNSQGFPGVTMVVFQTPGSNATQVIEDIKVLLEDASKNFPEGIKYTMLMDTNAFLYASIEKVMETLIEAFILVFIVVYVFLQDFRSTLIPAIAVPVSIIGTFFFLYIFGFTINLLTLFALVLAIAIVVDDAIVVVEAVHAKLDSGYKSATKASIDAMSEISGAIISITLVMSAVFLPVTFIGGTTGVFYTQFGVTLAVAILLSAVNALTLSPALCAIFLSPKDGAHAHGQGTSLASRFHKAFNAAFDASTAKYKGIIEKMMHRKWTSFGLVAASIGILMLLMNITPKGLIPNEDNGVLFISVDMPPATSLEKTQEILAEMDSMLVSNPYIKARTKVSGMGIISGNGSSFGTFICMLKPWDERTEKGSDIKSVIGGLNVQFASIKEAKVMVFAPPTLPGFGTTNGFEFSLQDKTGGDLDRFFAVSQEFLGALNQRPEIAYAMTSFTPTFPQYMINIDVEKAKIAGTTPKAILGAMQGYYGGLYASNFNQFGKLYRVMVKGDAPFTASPETLENVFIRINGQMAPITQFVYLEPILGPQNITRFNLFTSIPINGAPAPGYSSGQALEAVKQVAEQTLPMGYGYEFSGLTREEQSTGNQVVWVMALCLIFVYFLLCAQYESYILPIGVILSLPFGLAGSFIFAQFMGVDNNIYLQLALIMLIGLLAKNAILINQFALDRRKAGESLIQAAIDGAVARLRPILMTSFALIFGLIPLMLASGVGAEGNRSIGTAAVGGMLIGTALQIFVVPVLFVAFQGLQEKFKKEDPELSEI